MWCESRRICAVAIVALLGGCERDGLDRPALLDPASCQSCHPDAYREWAGSMHAYASDDPVFLATNRLGQRETGGALGTLCVGCHAPIAVATGAFDDPAAIADVPQALHGVTCVACHQIEAVTELHNGALVWADDLALRGAIADPIATPAHGSVYAGLLDGSSLASSAACGACHDVALGDLGVEQTYVEWSGSVFADDAGGLSCAGCHMPGHDGPAAQGERTRRVHDHGFPGVDTALVAWPGTATQRAQVDRDLGGVLLARLCVQPAAAGVQAAVTLDNAQGGHAFPSGVTHARRAFVELVAAEQGVTTFTSGDYAADEHVPLDDASVWTLGSRFLGADGGEVGRVWEAAAIERFELPAAVTRDPADPAYYHAVTRTYLVAGAPDRIDLAVHLQAMNVDIIDDLIGTGDLDPEIRDRLVTLELGSTVRQWRRDRDGWGCAP
jgi:hypothetical protein